MNRKLLASGLVLLMMAVLLPANAYHIDGQGTAVPEDQNPFPATTTTLSTSDWRYETGLLAVVCESEGRFDDINSNTAPSPGIGGLCYTGRNDATGVNAPGAGPLLGPGCEDNIADLSAPVPPVFPLGPLLPAPGPASFFDFTAPGGCMPGYSDFTRLDTCSLTIFQRSTAFGPFGPTGPVFGPVANPRVAVGCPGLAPSGLPYQHEHSWFAQLGSISCLVAHDPIVPGDEALYYSERYAWWVFEGGAAPYSEGDSAGGYHRGSAAALSGTVGRRDAYHGHVTMFLDPPPFWPNPLASTDGSAVTMAVVAPVVPETVGPASYNDCGASPEPDPANGMPSGPMFLGP